MEFTFSEHTYDMMQNSGFRQWLENVSIYQTAMEKLRPYAELWNIQGKGKRLLFRAYNHLSQEERDAIDREVENTFMKRYGRNEIDLFRRSTDNEAVGGMSLSDIPSNDPFQKKRKFRVNSRDVMLHWAQPLSVLQHMSHEHEVILKPNAHPQEIDVSHQYVAEKDLDNREIESDPELVHEMLLMFARRRIPVNPQDISSRKGFYQTLEKAGLIPSDYENFKDAYETGYESAMYRLGKKRTGLE